MVVATVKETVMDWKQASDYMFQDNDDIKFIGVYSADTYEPFAITGSDKINILQKEISAIVTHIRSMDNIVARIKISGLYFACMSFGSDRMTGMSNFNLDEQSRADADKILFQIAKIRYTRQASFEAKHMLTISAIIYDDTVLVGIAVHSETSSVLKVLQGVMSQKKSGAVAKGTKKQAPKLSIELKKSYSDAKDKQQIKAEADTTETPINQPTTAEQDHATEPTNKPTDAFELKELGVAEVQRRASTKAEIERRKDSTRRETEFCEDWRTATIRSIEALRNIGPFDAGAPFDDDQRPLIESESGDSTGQQQGNDGPTGSKARRASRPTMV